VKEAKRLHPSPKAFVIIRNVKAVSHGTQTNRVGPV